MSAGGEKQREYERLSRGERKVEWVNKGHFRASEIPWMLGPLRVHLEFFNQHIEMHKNVIIFINQISPHSLMK